MLNQQSRGWLKAIGVIGLGVAALSGCAAPDMERQHVQVHVIPTTVGTGWIYRSADSVEPILAPGKHRNQSANLSDSADYLMRIWSEHTPSLAYGQDADGRYALLTFDDTGTQRLNPLKGGFMSWGIADMADEIRQTTQYLQSRTPNYSVHLMATRDDKRPYLEDEDVAQVRLRRMADGFLEYGHDPRLLTGQVLPRLTNTDWKLAIAFRPYKYGKERESHHLVAPASL